jgi:hypothetical protein
VTYWLLACNLGNSMADPTPQQEAAEMAVVHTFTVHRGMAPRDRHRDPRLVLWLADGCRRTRAY